MLNRTRDRLQLALFLVAVVATVALFFFVILSDPTR